MLFNSFEFIFYFLPVAAAGYYCLGTFSCRAAAAWLCVVSFWFYGWQNLGIVILLASSILFNYVLGRILWTYSHAPRWQGWLLFFGISVNVGLLCYFKYLFPLLSFAKDIGILNQSFGSVGLPIGISFFTFTQIGYLVDSKSELAKENSLINYALFVSFFPHLIAGPIVHHKEIMPQFAHSETYKFRIENLSVGLTVFVIGLAKKVLLADRIAPWAEAGFASPDNLALFASWVTVLSYSLQLYFDFSGYSDMAIGLAKIFGVRFPLNFDSPYRSPSIIEFWQRWHMTLTRFLNLYIYNPIALTVTRYRTARGLPVGRRGTTTFGGFVGLVLVPTFSTMAIAGVWHGAGLQFLIFGLLHACYLSINHAWRIFGPKVEREPDRFLSQFNYLANVLLTFTTVLIAEVFFRADSAGDAVRIICGLVGANGIEHLHENISQQVVHLPDSISVLNVQIRSVAENILAWKRSLVLAGLFSIVWFAPNTHDIMGKFSPALAKPRGVRLKILSWQPSVWWATLTSVVFFCCLVMLQSTAKFLYFQF